MHKLINIKHPDVSDHCKQNKGRNHPFNAGIFSCSLDWWKREKITDHLLKWIEINIMSYTSTDPQIKKGLYKTGTQPLMNLTISTWKEMSIGWNYSIYDSREIISEKTGKLQGGVCLIHYLGSPKPWESDDLLWKSYTIKGLVLHL